VGEGPSGNSWPIAAAKTFVALALGVLLYVAHAALIPVALALLLALILSGPVETLHRKGIPRGSSAAVILILALSLIGGTVALIWTPAQGWYARAPQTIATIKQKVRPVARFIDRVDEFRKSASSISPSRPSVIAPATVGAAPASWPSLFLGASGAALAAMLTFVIVTLFLLSGGPPMLARMTAAFVGNLQRAHVLEVIEKVRAEVGHFYLTTTLINVGLGTATAVTMWVFGMPTPLLWGALAATLNYIPYAGSLTTLLIITLVAVVSFDGTGRVFAVAGAYILLATLEGQVAQPLLIGRRLAINPLFIFLGLWFGGLFWGVAGILLATPILVAVKVIAENSASAKSMTEFLGPEAPKRDERLRQLSRRLRR
jgi:predicted PurR-regulated permease PerM